MSVDHEARLRAIAKVVAVTDESLAESIDAIADQLAEERGRLSFDVLRRANVTRCEADFRGCVAWSTSDWVTALVGEVGEMANFIKKRRRGDGDFHQEIADELADVQAYLDLLAWHLGIDLGQATAQKFNVVSERIGSNVMLLADTLEGGGGDGEDS